MGLNGLGNGGETKKSDGKLDSLIISADVLINFIASKITFSFVGEELTKSLKIMLQFEPSGKSNVAIVLNCPGLWFDQH